MDRILILDFGSQYNQLIARRLRSLGVCSEIHPFHLTLEEIIKINPKALILSGGPSSVFDEGAPRFHFPIEKVSHLPIFGICYGMQALVQETGGTIVPAQRREYGQAEVQVLAMSGLAYDRNDNNGKRHVFPREFWGKELSVWMSHGDSVSELSQEWITIAQSKNSAHVSVAHRRYPWFGVQFHPEVSHTEGGLLILDHFVTEIAGCKKNWKGSNFLEQAELEIRGKVPSGKVICGISGGIDSLVTALVVKRAIADRLVPVLVDTGLLREGEVLEIVQGLRGCGIEPQVVDAREDFLSTLRGVRDPEEKRKKIGVLFIEIFHRVARLEGGASFLAQGTLYPDVIESISTHGPSHTIKSHHNVGGLPKELPFQLVEPLRTLFKDEVRELANHLGVPSHLIRRQPFPGPGLAIRIMGEVTQERVAQLRAADRIVREVVEKDAALAVRLWQWFAVLIPVKTVGVMGDQRTYEHLVAVRIVESADGMTADWVDFPAEKLREVSSRIINEVRGVNRVVYDISSKPPSTIEWE